MAAEAVVVATAQEKLNSVASNIRQRKTKYYIYRLSFFPHTLLLTSQQTHGNEEMWVPLLLLINANKLSHMKSSSNSSNSYCREGDGETIDRLTSHCQSGWLDLCLSFCLGHEVRKHLRPVSLGFEQCTFICLYIYILYRIASFHYFLPV